MNQFDEHITKKIIKQKKGKKFKEPLIAFGFILFLIIGFSAGFFTRPKETNNTTTQNSLSNFERVFQIIANDWVFSNELDDSLENLAIKGFLNQLNDYHTVYLTKEETIAFIDSGENNYSGIGVLISIDSENNDKIRVKLVVAGSPADKSGIKRGDYIISVDGIATEGLNTTEIGDLVKGEEGTKVTITIERDGNQFEITATRGALDSSVMYDVREENGIKFGYLYIANFGTTSELHVETALQHFEEENIKHLVLDLRDNTGGYLTTVHSILDLFFPKGEELFHIQKNSGKNETYTSSNSKHYSFSKGYILTNEYTASASEVMAGALSELLDYELVGTTSYGKGTAQTTITLNNLNTLKYTYAKWLLPSGRSINGIGLEPDYEVENINLNSFSAIKITEPLEYDLVSEEVMTMQKILQTLGYQTDRVDGYFSNQTVEALKSFEADYNLNIDGIYTEEDNQILIRALISFTHREENDFQYLKILDLLK